MTDQVVASHTATTVPKQPNQKPLLAKVPADRPGIVIFLHGVNDPGATYENVEKGLCEGLNWRLNRTDLVAGEYGGDWKTAKNAQAKAAQSKTPLTATTKATLSDPDTYLYKRKEIEQQTNSIFIPFYWGYRAANNEIAGGEAHPVLMRGQHQDTKTNRLDANFAKEGGFFDNATNNIPDMYGMGFKRDRSAKLASNFTDDYTYIGDSPERHYFVLAAHRLAMLIREIRAASPSSETNDETITVIGHSQGTIIGLLAQAILMDEGGDSRPADAMILVDSPYALWENSKEEQTTQAKLKTLANIAQAVASKKHANPAPSELVNKDSNPKHQGRTGPKWSPTGGVRPIGQNNAPVSFVERDNRGKIYAYFSPDDSVVGLSSIAGIGTFGVPNTIDALVLGSSSDTFGTYKVLPAMDVLKAPKYGFYQRMWTKKTRQGKPVPVGLTPASISIREPSEPEYPGGDGVSSSFSERSFFNANQVDPATSNNMEERWINGEAINPPYAPNMQHGETTNKKGKPTGQLPVDAVAVDVALGNSNASHFQRIPMSWSGGDPNSVALQQQFNQGKDPADQTQNVWVTPHSSWGEITNYTVEREETPNEAQARLAGHDATDNNYHSGILNDPANIRAVAAMDVAIGQAKTLDDKEWRPLLLAMADWRTDWSPGKQPKAIMDCYNNLSAKAQALLKATNIYYKKGTFPSEDLVPTKAFPSLVKGQTKSDRGNKRNDPGAVA